jgi:sulfoxide reductase heme-binding subunit YedZ
MPESIESWTRGWKLTIGISIGLAALTAVQLAVWGVDEEGVRVVVRSTARSSVLLFALAFCASSARTLWRNETTKWLLANRRYVGVSYAASHSLHLLGLVALAGVSPEFAGSVDAVTLVGGGLAYVFTYAMAATSSDAAVRTLGRTNWRRLHVVGSWYIWIIFAQSYLPRAAMDPRYLVAGIVVMAVPVIRFSARTRRRAEQLQAA